MKLEIETDIGNAVIYNKHINEKVMERCQCRGGKNNSILQPFL